MSLTMKVTSAGRAALINASNTGTAPVTIAEIGLSETAVVPSAAAAALPGEFKRIAGVAGDVVAADTIHVNVTDGSADTYALRSFALYLDDGTLFAIYGQADPFLEKTAQSIAAISIDAVFADIDAAMLTFGDTNFLNPPATTERAGVVELLTSVEAIAGADTERAATAKAVKEAVTAWLDARFGANNAGIWHPGNDGAGSGLDADTLDGQQGSYYANIPGRLGFMPIQQGTGAGQLANTIKVGWSGTHLKATVDVTDQGHFVFDSHIADVWRASNDGAGSGLDADMLDGQHATYFTNIPARLGYTPASRAGDIFTGTVRVRFAGNGYVELVPSAGGDTGQVYFCGNDNVRKGYIYAPASGIMEYGNDSGSGHNFNGGPIRRDGNSVWDAANDGAGSGLDADLLDGLHASDFVRSNSPGVVRAAAYAAPTSSLIYNAYNVSSITYSPSGGSGNGARAIVAYTNPVPNSVPVAMGGDTANSSSSHSAFWGSGSSRHDNGFTACFGVSGGGGLPRLFSFITVGT